MLRTDALIVHHRRYLLLLCHYLVVRLQKAFLSGGRVHGGDGGREDGHGGVWVVDGTETAQHGNEGDADDAHSRDLMLDAEDAMLWTADRKRVADLPEAQDKDAPDGTGEEEACSLL